MGLQSFEYTDIREFTDAGQQFTYTSTYGALSLRLRSVEGCSQKLHQLHGKRERSHRYKLCDDQFWQGLGTRLFQSRNFVVPLLDRNITGTM